MKTVNLTIKIEESQIQVFESFMKQHIEVVDFRILPDTNELYENDKTFRVLSKVYKTAKRDLSIYVNKHN